MTLNRVCASRFVRPYFYQLRFGFFDVDLTARTTFNRRVPSDFFRTLSANRGAARSFLFIDKFDLACLLHPVHGPLHHPLPWAFLHRLPVGKFNGIDAFRFGGSLTTAHVWVGVADVIVDVLLWITNWQPAK